MPWTDAQRLDIAGHIVLVALARPFTGSPC